MRTVAGQPRDAGGFRRLGRRAPGPNPGKVWALASDAVADGGAAWFDAP